MMEKVTTVLCVHWVKLFPVQKMSLRLTHNSTHTSCEQWVKCIWVDCSYPAVVDPDFGCCSSQCRILRINWLT